MSRQVWFIGCVCVYVFVATVFVHVYVGFFLFISIIRFVIL